MKYKNITIPDFTPTEWSTNEDKQEFAKQFLKFVDNGFQKEDFPKWFYTRLSMCFGHIAHYDQNGFYQTWFNTKRKQISFLENELNYPCYGDPTFTFSDVESWLRKQNLLMEKWETLQAEVIEEVEQKEREKYLRLQEKFGDKDA